jgi:hypothetical protein
MTRARTLSKLGSDPLVTDGTVVAGITTIDASGLNITGVITATTFKGDVTGSATGLSGNITSSGTLSITDATASTSSSTGALKVSGGVGIAKSLFVGEGVSIAGTITYDDVTNIDSVGVVTAGKGVVVTGAYPITLGTGTTIHQVASNTLAVGTNNVESLRIDSSGRLLLGSTATVDTSTYNSSLQIMGTGANDSSAIIGRFSADGSSPNLNFSKSRNATIGSHTIVADGDQCGGIYFWGSDGVDYEGVGYIAAQVDGTPGSNDTPGRLVFATTADGAAAATERMRITANAGFLLSNGILVEHCKIVSTAWSTTNDISLDDGNVFLNTANLAGTTNTIDITSSNGIANDLAVGDMTSVTLITAVNAATAYINEITIGAASVTESWVGGSAPTDGGSSGYDVYTFNIIKTAATPTYVVIANQVKGS